MKTTILSFVILMLFSQVLSAQDSPVPAHVQIWFKTELAKGKKKTLLNYASPQFFSSDTARLIGYIKGYNRSLGFSTGMVYASNEITNTDYPLIVTIQEDGRFECKIPMDYPVFSTVAFKDEAVRFYIEPGQTLAVAFNWDEVLKSGGSREARYMFKDIQFDGPAARINRELASVSVKDLSYKEFQENVKTMEPVNFREKMALSIKESEAQLQQDLNGKDYTSQAKTILHHELILSATNRLFDYVMDRDYNAKKDPANKVLQIPVDTAYYDFLQKVPLNDPSILISRQFSTFINRFEFCKPLFYAANNSSAQKYIPFEQYLFKELGLKPTAEDTDYIDFQKTLNGKLNGGISAEERKVLIAQFVEKSKPFSERYKQYREQHNAKYPRIVETLSQGERFLRDWRLKDSVLANYFHLEPNMAYEIIKVRSLKFTFDFFTKLGGVIKNPKDEARTFLTSFEKGISNTFFMLKAEEVFRQSFPAVSKTSYDLPSEKGAEILRKITDQFKGKIVFIDFWATTCAPCIAAIQQNKPIRERYKNSKELEFVFLTSENESPTAAYNQFIKDQGLVRTYRLPPDDFRYLRQLFKFNGIPRYVVLSKDGQVLNDDFEMYNFEHQINSLLATK